VWFNRLLLATRRCCIFLAFAQPPLTTHAAAAAAATPVCHHSPQAGPQLPQPAAGDHVQPGPPAPQPARCRALPVGRVAALPAGACVRDVLRVGEDAALCFAARPLVRSAAQGTRRALRSASRGLATLLLLLLPPATPLVIHSPPHAPPHPMQQRIVRMGGPVDDDMANLIVAQLLYLDSASADKDITMYVNSPGGSVTAGEGGVSAWCSAQGGRRAGWPVQATHEIRGRPRITHSTHSHPRLAPPPSGRLGEHLRPCSPPEVRQRQSGVVCVCVCCAVLCCAVPCRAVPCRAVPCCAVPGTSVLAGGTHTACLVEASGTASSSPPEPCVLGAPGPQAAHCKMFA
jgi:hypothetical protein